MNDLSNFITINNLSNIFEVNVYEIEFRNIPNEVVVFFLHRKQRTNAAHVFRTVFRYAFRSEGVANAYKTLMSVISILNLRKRCAR